MPAGAKIYLRTCACGCGKEFQGSTGQKFFSLRCQADARNRRRQGQQRAMPKRKQGRKSSVCVTPGDRLTLHLNSSGRSALQTIKDKYPARSWNQCVMLALATLALRIELDKEN